MVMDGSRVGKMELLCAALMAIRPDRSTISGWLPPQVAPVIISPDLMLRTVRDPSKIPFSYASCSDLPHT